MKRVLNSKLLLIILFLFVLILVKPDTSYAASSQALTVSPANAQIKLNQGSINSGSFNVINQGSGTYSFKVYATPYSVKGEDYSPDYTPVPGATNISDWFKFSLKNSTASEGQSIQVDYTITVPKNVQDGGYYAVAFAETNNPKASVGVTINERVGMLFFIQVGNNVVKSGLVQSFTSKFLQYPPLTSTVKVANTGSIYYKADFEYRVKDIFGGTKYLLKGQKIILPQTIRKLELPWKNSPAFGLFKVSGNVNFLGNDHLLGTKYVLVMSKTARIISISSAVLVVILFTVIAIIKSKSKRKNKYLRRR